MLRAARLGLSLLAPALAAGAEPQPPLVVSWRIEAEPALAERLRAYVTLEQGKPLSATEVRRSVELLVATGELEDVVVDSLPEAGGVAVVFRPIAAPRMTDLQLRGDRVIGAKQVRLLTRLRWDELLWQSRIDEAARDVAVELGRRGYLEARVTGVVQRAPSGAAAVFEVHAGPLARVEDLGIDGAPPETRPALLVHARPRRGEAWSGEAAQRAAEQMRRVLVERSRWRAQVEPRELYDPKTASVKLRFVVDAGPRVSIGYRGTRPGADQRRALERVVRQGGARAEALDEALDQLEQELHAHGHRSPSLRYVEERTPPDRLEIVYEVDAGAPAQVASLRVLGVDELDFELPRLETQPFTPLRDDRLERDAAALRRTLYELGFASARVEVDVPDGGGELPVVFRAEPGPKASVAEVELAVPTDSDVTPPALLTQAGAVYRVSSIARDKAALLGAWHEQGYPRAEVEPRLEWSDDRRAVKVLFEIAPGARARIGEIVIAGLRQTRPEIVRRELGLQSGDPYSPARLLEAQRRLQGLGIFERVSVRELLSGSGETLPVVIEVREASRAAVAYGLGYAERDLLRGSVEVTVRNLMGMDRSLSTFARVSFRGSRLVATYREPRLLGRKQELFTTVFREEQERDGFDFVRRGGQLQGARSLSSRLTLITRLTYQQTDVFNVTVPLDEIDRQFRSSTFAGPSSSIVFDTRDDPLDPKRGRFLSADLALSDRLIGGDSFARSFLQAASFSPLRPRLVLALQGRLGLGRTFREEPPRLPLPDRFFAGGDYSLRGFKTDFVGPLEPGADGELHPTGGNALLLGSVELRWSASPRLEIAGFSDFGNVYPLASDLDLRDLRSSVGVGLRYKSSIGPIRLDWGYKLNRRPGESAREVHVTVGHAF
jgi:outer membrane protein assembly complex protein YaeT